MDTATSTPAAQRRHESPDLGDAIVRMLRALVTRAAEGDTEAIEQLARVERLSGTALTYGAQLAHMNMGYSFTQLADVLGVSRQAARQRVDRLTGRMVYRDPDAHQLVPGHHRRTCKTCQQLPSDRVAGV